MLNQTIVVGRVCDLKKSSVKLAIPRPYKNAEGIYESDFITCKVRDNIANSVKEYVKIGDLIGVKGRLECGEDDGRNTIVVAEKVTFLSSKKSDEGE